MTNDVSGSVGGTDPDQFSSLELASQIRRSIESATLLDVSSSERVETMLSITRKPPRMQIAQRDESLFEEAEVETQNDLEEVTAMGQDTLILGLASIVLRHENALRGVENPRVLDGFDEVVMQLKMFHHLNVMTSAAGS